MHDPLVGTELGHFKIDRLIAEGGMGLIYQATHKVIGRKAAIKVLSERFSSDGNMIKRLHREAQAVNRIGHPNIVDIFDFGRTPDNREYFVMEYLPGESLAQLQERLGRLPWSLIAPIFTQALDALAAAHDLNIVHRDIKPENIIVVQLDQGELLVKVLDFGIAKSLGLGPEGERLTRVGSVMGTPEYIAPEQIRGRDVDGRADLYAMGVILFELIMGRRPFESEKVIELLMAHLKLPVPAMEGIPAELAIPQHVPAVINKAMAKEAEERFPDARTFARALGLEVISTAPAEGTRPLPDTYWGEGEASPPGATPATAASLPAQATRPSAGGPLASVTRQGKATALQRDLAASRFSTLRLLVPVALVFLCAAAVLFYFALRPGKPEAPKESQPVAAASQPTAAPQKLELGTLVDQVWRTLRMCLSVPQPEARRLCVQGIGALRDEESLVLLTSALREDPSREVRSAAAMAIATLGEAQGAAALHEALGQSNPTMRVWINEALMRLGLPGGRLALEEALKDKSEEIRFQAALALGEAGQQGALPVLKTIAGRVATLDRETMIAVLGTLAKLGHEESYNSLKIALTQEDPLLRLGAAEALARLGNEEAHQILAQIQTDGSDLPSRLVAAKLLASLGDYSGLALIQQQITAEDPAVRRLAAEGLGSIGDKAALAPLARALEDKNWLVKATAAASLAHLLSLMPEALVRHSQDWIKTALANRDWSVRFAAVGVTSEMDPELAVNLLGWAIQDKDPRVRAAVVSSLQRLGSPMAVPLLTRALRDSSDEVRAQAAVALGKIGDRSISDALHEAAADRSPEVSAMAVGALLAMGDKTYLPKLKEAARARDPRIRRAVITALGKWNDPEALALLLQGLKDQAPTVRLAASRELARRGNDAGLTELQRALGRGGKDRELALAALAELNQTPTAALEELAGSRAAADRAAAMEGAASLEGQAALALLTQGAGDAAPQVRLATARAFARFKGKPVLAIPLLRRLLRDPDPAVGAQARLALAKYSTGIDGLLLEPIQPVEPAPLTPLPAPRSAKGRGEKSKPDPKAKLSFEDADPIKLYKNHITNAALATSRGRYPEALRLLRAAQRYADKPPIQYEFGYVHLKLAVKSLSSAPAGAEKHLNTAKQYFQQYLRRAPGGSQAKDARRGLRDVARLLKQLR